MTAPEQTNAPEAPAVGGPVQRPVRPLCSQCRFPLDEYSSGLRYFGTHTAHVEWYCVNRMRSEIDRLRAELAEAVTALPQAVRNERERWATSTANLLDAVVTCIEIQQGCAIDDWVKDARKLLRPNVFSTTSPENLPNI